MSAWHTLSTQGRKLGAVRDTDMLNILLYKELKIDYEFWDLSREIFK